MQYYITKCKGEYRLIDCFALRNSNWEVFDSFKIDKNNRLYMIWDYSLTDDISYAWYGSTRKNKIEKIYLGVVIFNTDNLYILFSKYKQYMPNGDTLCN